MLFKYFAKIKLPILIPVRKIMRMLIKLYVEFAMKICNDLVHNIS